MRQVEGPRVLVCENDAVRISHRYAGHTEDASIDFASLTDILVSQITAEGFVVEGVTGTMTWDATGACTKVPVIVVLN